MFDTLILAATLLTQTPQDLPLESSALGLFNICVPFAEAVVENKSLEDFDHEGQLKINVCVSYFKGYLNGRKISDRLHNEPSFCGVDSIVLGEAILHYMNWCVKNKEILSKVEQEVAVTFALHEIWGCHEEKEPSPKGIEV